MFEYIFYRLYLSYQKHEPNTNHGISATLALSAFQFFIAGGVMIFISSGFDIDVLPRNRAIGKIVVLGLGALWVFYNYKHYTPKIKELEDRFANHPVNKWLKDWLFFLFYFLTSFSCLFFLPFLFIRLLRWILGG